MITRTMRRATLILAVLLVAGLMSACNQQPTATATTVSPSAPAETQTQAPQQAQTPQQTQTPQDAIKWSGDISVATYMFGPVDKNKDIITPKLEQALLKYGYDVNLEAIFIEYPQYAELLNTRIAGGTAPDIFLSISKEAMHSYYEQGAIASWDKDFFIKNAPNYYKYVQGGGYEGRLADYVDLFWEYAMVDDKMITIPCFYEAYCLLNKVVLYRGDWLDNLGVTELPMTMDDFTALMYRFANDDPDKDKKKDTYGMSTSMIKAVFGAYGNYTGFMGEAPQWYVKDGKMVCADLLPGNKEALTLLAKYYADGVLSPEFITGENSGGYWAISHAFINGLIGVSCLASIDHYRLPEVLGDQGGACAQEYLAVNGNLNFRYGPWPAGPNGDYGYKIGSAVTIGDNPLYNAKCDTEKLAAILGIMDAFAVDKDLFILQNQGVEGITFKYNEVQQPVALFDNVTMNTYGVGAYEGLYSDNAIKAEINFYNGPATKNVLKFQANKQCDSYYRNALTATLPSQEQYQDELITYRDETWIKIITGVLDASYWDTYVQDYLDKGGQKLIDEANAWYASK